MAAARGGDRRIYAIGGAAAFTPDQEQVVEAYSPRTNTWTQVANLPRGGDNTAAASLGGMIYAVGGEQDPCPQTPCVVADLDRYDPATGAWTALTPMPTARTALTAVALNGKIYAMGGLIPDGQSGFTASNAVEIYDPKLDQWNSGPPLPEGTWYASAVALGGRIFVIGGSTFGGPASTMYVYDPQTATWSVGVPLPAGRTEAAAAVGADGRIYVIGGFTPGADGTQVTAYSPLAGAWQDVAGIPKPGRADLAAASTSAGTALFAIGGYTLHSGTTTDKVNRLRIRLG